MKFFLSTVFLFTCFLSFSQKKIIDYTAYSDWKRIGDIYISNDGKFSIYTIKPQRGDGYLFLVNNETNEKDSFPRAVNPKFTSDSKGLIFKINPGFDTLRKCELNKVKKDKWPKDSLGIFYIEKDSLQKIAKVKDFSVAEESSRFAYLTFENKIPNESAGKKKKRKKKNKEEEESSSEGNLLVIKEISSKDYAYLKNVTDYKFSKNGGKIAYITHKKTKVDVSTISLIDFKETSKLEENSDQFFPTKSNLDFYESFSKINDFTFDESGNQLAYVASQDTISENKKFQLHYYDNLKNEKSMLVDTVQLNLPADKSVSEHSSPYFSLDGTQIFFGIGLKPIKTPKDSLLESEKAKLDVWNWKDNRLQAQQLVELTRDKKESLLSVYSLNSKSFIILENDSIKISHNEKNPSSFVIASNSNPYQTKYNWEFPNKQDYYRLNITNGEIKLLKKAAIYNVELSPSGKYFTYFDPANSEQYYQTVGTDLAFCITCNTKEIWTEDINGMSYVAGPLGIIRWEKEEEKMFIQAKYQIYAFALSTNSLTPLIKNENLKEKICYSIHLWNRDSLYINLENIYITGFNEKDKSESMYLPKWQNSKLDLTTKFESNHTYSGFTKAKYADKILFQKANILEYPDLYTANWSTSSEPKQLSKTNPQQIEYNWASVDLISWKSYNGIPLEGLLYKPEDYDSTKKYPLLIYYYEMYSDELHNHYVPKPTASIIYPTEYASAGYLVLIPDIRYKVGFPARGAYDCIMSGTDYVLKKYKSIDSTRMGLQGQSWGGYQTAQLITMTTRFKAAMAGAPVGNMFSAYGGIRWGSGLNRQFQYEHTQSRIGKTIWEAPELYIENSPLFHLPKVKTPLLIMHNDADGSVPWYQGIELFTGLKRLDKPVWMLNYNGDDHNLMKNANRIDLSIRMRQFFDYYLQDKPAPIWLIDGVPAINKGKNYGLDLK